MTPRAVGALLAAALVAACQSSDGRQISYAGKTIQLGAVLSLVGSGAATGVQSRDGMLLAVKQINDSGGVRGARIELTVVDDASDKAIARQKAQGLIQQGQVLALLGPTLANSAVEVHPLAESLKTPILAVSISDNHIVPDCNYPDTTPCRYVFRDSLGDQTAIPIDVKTYADAAHPKTAVLLVAADDKSSAEGARIAEEAFGRYNVQLLQTIPFSRDQADVSTYVNQAVQLRPDVIFISSVGATQARIMIDARNLGWQGQFLGGNGLNAAAVSKQAGAAGKGARSAGAWYAGDDSARNKTFVEAYQKEYGRDPDQYAAQAFAGIHILADAAARAGLTFTGVAADRDRLRAAMEGVDVQTPLGRFQFTAGHDVRQTVWIVQMDGRGGFSPVTKV